MKKYHLIPQVALALLINSAGLIQAAEMNADHANMHGGHNMQGIESRLTEAGNDAFGTLQEALQQLLSDPQTDWSKVNMEALRQHLADMRNLTLGIEIVRQTPLKNGLEIILKPHNPRVSESLDRVFAAHPAQLRKETGWEMKTRKQNGEYQITITTRNQTENAKIQGLGYIGIMAWGNHHQSHHWMMVKGMNPH